MFGHDKEKEIHGKMYLLQATKLITQGKWMEHLDKMPEGRLPEIIFSYRPRGSRDIGRPRKCWTEARTGLQSILERQNKNIYFNLEVLRE